MGKRTCADVSPTQQEPERMDPAEQEAPEPFEHALEIEEELEDDEISSGEAAFVRGYLTDRERAQEEEEEQ